MQKRVQSMDIYNKPVRRNKKLSKNIIMVEKPEKISNTEKIINVLKEHKKGLTVTEIHFKTKIPSMGYLHHEINFMVRLGHIKRESCPHCNSTILYTMNQKFLNNSKIYK